MDVTAIQQVATELAKSAVAITGQKAEDAAEYTAKYAPLVLHYGLQLAQAKSDEEKAKARRMLSSLKSQAIAEGGRLGLQLEQQHLKEFAAGIDNVVNLVVTKGLPALAAVVGGPAAGAVAAAVTDAIVTVAKK